MKIETLQRATEFMKTFSKFLAEYQDFTLATDMFNNAVGTDLKCACGAVREVVICNDFVVKWDYNIKNVKSLGGCAREFEVYNAIRDSKFAYLFAEIAPIQIGKKTYWVMPRVKQMAYDLENDDIDNYLSDEEMDFLYEEAIIYDLHSCNWGLIDGHPVIIDYACGPESAS